jgi:DNA helicase II / ATP-dependent DNA helicase PcrA
VLEVVRRKVGQGGLDASAAALDRWTHGAIAAHGDDLDALAALAGLEPDPARFGAWLANELERPDDIDGVTLASIHSVKGREWPHVVVHHATAGLMPHRLAEDEEEERRVFHVALTRGRLTVAVVPGTAPSPFIAELSGPGQPPARPTKRTPPVEPAPPRKSSGADVVAAASGLGFAMRGHEHEITELRYDGVLAVIGEGPATTALAYGTEVMVEGSARVLGHPASPAAWERLRAWRSERSKALGKPAFVVFDDKTLRLIAAVLPTSETALLAISGVGQVKLEAYGDDLLAMTTDLRAG